MVVELTFVLLLVMSGEKIEYTPTSHYQNACPVRRKIKRNTGSDEKWSCKGNES